MNASATYNVIQKYMDNKQKEIFSLRPEMEKIFGYSHAIRIGNSLKVSGTVSMDSMGNPTAAWDILQQMKNCYADIRKVLHNFGVDFNDVVMERIYTTDIELYMKAAEFRTTVYKQFPATTLIGVKELALPPFMIEIELEAYITN